MGVTRHLSQETLQSGYTEFKCLSKNLEGALIIADLSWLLQDLLCVW